MKKVFGIVGIIIIALIVIFMLKKNTPTVEAPITREEVAVSELTGAIDLGNSSVRYTGYGAFGAQSGDLILTEESMVNVKPNGEILTGTLVFDMTALTSDNAGLAEHLKNKDFFEVDAYPTGAYTITEVVATPLDPDHDIIINGELTLKDQTHAHNVAAAYEPTTGVVLFSTEIDRTKWGIEFNSSAAGTVGDALIKDNVLLEVVLDID